MLQIADGMLNGTRTAPSPRGIAVVWKAVSERPSLGRFLEETRRRKRFSIQALSRESGVSAGYIGQIESGTDPRTGKPARPSPEVLRLLARALSDGDEDEGERIYGEMMDSAGYLPTFLRAEDSGKATETAKVIKAEETPSRSNTTIQVIVRLNPGTEGLSDEDKQFLERLAERSQIILDGGEDPGP